MKTHEFLTILNEHQDKRLYFEYQPNQLVAPNYHITEIKHVHIDSVDCGAQTDNWTETVVQLWESPMELFKTKPMSVKKAMGILNKVGSIKDFKPDSEIKFEYGNVSFHTAQMFVNDFSLDGRRIIFRLSVEKTRCKAEELCGISEKIEAVMSEPCCSPNSGCC